MAKSFDGSNIPPTDRRDFLKLGAGVGALALAGLSPRGVSAQSGGTHSGSVDAHAHWVPQGYADALGKLGHPTTSIHTPMELDSNLEQRLKWMDAHGIQMHVLTLDGGMPWEWVSPPEGARLAQIVNDAAAAAHMKYPERFIAGIELSTRDPELALKELNRMAGKPGMRAVHLPNSLDNTDYLFETK